MTVPVEFREWPKTTRLSKTSVVITEKIDGTNACIVVTEDGVFAQSRKRLVTPESDNYGFARWVKEHEGVLSDELGPGYHYGEWWGLGIGRGYDQQEKRFSLFDANRWVYPDALSCCGVVPVLYRGRPDDMGIGIRRVMEDLRVCGSQIPEAQGFERPEGICVTHDRRTYKVLLENDDIHKGQAA